MRDQINKAVIYVRVSSKEQEREGFSIPAQKKFLQQHAVEHGFKVIRVFEETESAKSAGRQQFKIMLQFLKENLDIKNILVEKTDRLYRNIKDYNDLNFEELNISVHLVKENEVLSKDSRSHQKFIHGIKVLMAKNYSDNLSEEVRKGQLEKASQGFWPSCAPIGYINNLEHVIVPDTKVSPLITKAFELAATGQYSLSKLKKQLYEYGLRSARSRKELGKQAMARILKNSIYYGEFCWKSKLYKGKHAPLTTKQTFDKVQIVMGFTLKPKLTKHNFSFASLMTCAHCGCSITAEKKIKKSGKTFTYYHCTNGKKLCANVVFLREEKVEEAFAGALSKLRISEEVIKWTRNALLQSYQDEKRFRETELSVLESRYRDLQSKIERCYEDKLDGRITIDFWESRTAKWKQEQDQIENTIKGLRIANTDYLEHGVKLMEIAKRASELFKVLNVDEKREMLNLVLSNPRVMNGNIEYDYKMPFSMFLNVTDLEKWRSRVDGFRTWCASSEFQFKKPSALFTL